MQGTASRVCTQHIALTHAPCCARRGGLGSWAGNAVKGAQGAELRADIDLGPRLYFWVARERVQSGQRAPSVQTDQSRISTEWLPPCLFSKMLSDFSSTPSNVIRRFAPEATLWLMTQIKYVVGPYRYVNSKPGQFEGMQGWIVRRSPCRRNPRIDSIAARYIQLEEPVYQVHPPRPTLGAQA